ncbi:MAG: hypothetical protein J6R18_07660 [Kiritimatiellae bacterium]|nr:hypothetical protein [Kiritimatiellia bacterium]
MMIRSVGYLKSILATLLVWAMFAVFVPCISYAADPWLVELRSFDAIQSRQATVGKTLGNAMLPMLLVSFFQQRTVGMFGKMRSAEPVRWAGYPDGKGRYDIVMVYPTIDKAAKMVLHHPGAEKVSQDTVLLPADEGRPIQMYAVFSKDFEWCAFGATQELCRRALLEKYPESGNELFAVSSGAASGAFDFDDKGFKFTARTVTPETAAKLKGVPLLGSFAEKGVTHYVKFEDVKKLVASLFKEMAVAKGILKGDR